MPAALTEFVDPELSALLLNPNPFYCSMLNNCSVFKMGSKVRDQLLEKSSYSSVFGSTPGRGEMVKQDLIAENAAIKDELYSYLREELRKQTHELFVLREISAEKDRAALSMQIQLEKIVEELEQAVVQALENQERITMQMEAKVQNLETIIEQRNQDAKLRDDAQNLADRNAADKGEEFERALEEKDVLIAGLREQLKQNLTPSAAVKKAVSNAGWSW